ncbi:MAG: hypothetical protein FWE85_02275 [Clostridiales bacterium]|nr:hypothetical protein [Clostridiales bacterium]
MEWMCCFCGKSIENKEDCLFLVILKGKKRKAEESSQELSCHLECMKKNLHKNAPLYIEFLGD